MKKNKTTWAHIQMLSIVTVFMAPLVFGAWMYYGGYFDSEKQEKSAYALNPVNLYDVLSKMSISKQVEKFWALVYSNRSRCLEDCQNDLKILKESHEIIVRKIDNVIQVFLHGESLPDKVFLDNEHKELIVVQDYVFSDLLEKKIPTTMNMSGYFLIDPQGKLVMYFEPKTDPKNIVQGLESLLEKSHIN
tara:strand:+ start:1599 stop:2168 length:570 start_codon:yes stop_codon:yes gene_type:complete